MQVSADLVQFHERRRLSLDASGTDLRRRAWQAESAVHGRLVGRFGQRPQRGDVLGWPSRAHESRAELGGGRRDQLDRDPVGRDPGVGIEQRNDLGQGREALAHAFRIVRADDDREALRLVRPTPRVSRRDSAERSCNLLGDRSSAREQETGRPRASLALERREDPRFRRGADSRHLE